ncbi:MAG: hypothetical protein KKH12_07740 [Gammaproteobacteria bacterium]|nr:hypothetical protein [Gammaproteobacteria bacterium]MBU1481553.1 hypothetical protein [Gammaproteobacteria bacterium]
MPIRTQQGFSLVSAIFLLVVLAGLGAGMVTFSTAQNQSQAMDTMGSRAYQAANAGIEWAAYNIAVNPGVPGGVTFGPIAGNALGGNLAPFEVTVVYGVTVQIDDTGYPPGGTVAPVTIYNITSTAVWGTPGTPNYVERELTAKMY